MKKSNMSVILTSIICLIPFVISAVFYNQLPDQVATHFNGSGIPDGYSPRIVAAFVLPAFLFIINLITNFAIDKNPIPGRGGKIIGTIGKWTVPVISVFVQAFIIAYACGIAFNVTTYVLISLGLLTIIIGNYLPKCPQNNVAGIKTPWTLKDKDNWKKTHRISGYLWVVCGFILCANAFINVEFINIAVFTIMIAVPIMYSYVYEKNK